ncbi:Prolipoprotein diacylglyceryl transferase [Thalassovita autumnalis]|uniref:Phosphatidylglycerol--prolipoprotein diacylglyceryl transferase n=1 Tax=Thalassovita autumnalis TaxID=2072972 RepID=A0A0P1F512_9RHOB|nr:prolipoprotein diacylglyceryl transferase [Thalassovita autumnalis]CUH62896.1 Prolipoprotein diacylglyceryl transferase [Thalassovita autumnalis]CUH72165.1 Prolipoprotein diacylglyceryl transferase [Thalassovita autumnalis]
MQAMIPFPDISPEIFSISLFGITFALRWYALAYIGGILIGWRLIVMAASRPQLWPGDTAPMSKEQVEDLLTWIILGVILGGRLGYVLFYKPAYYLDNPSEILMVWQGGMAFHGGFLGVVVAAWIWAGRQGVNRLSLGDSLALAVPTGLLLGRVANFINGELWGRPTDVPWGVAFPGPSAQTCEGVIGLCARHPSQLYEAALEGLLLGALLLVLAFRRDGLKVPGQLMGLFVAGYGLSRFIVEFFRQADDQFITLDNPMGYVIQMGQAGVTMGQILSLPMLLIGLAIFFWARRQPRQGAPA